MALIVWHQGIIVSSGLPDGDNHPDRQVSENRFKRNQLESFGGREFPPVFRFCHPTKVGSEDQRKTLVRYAISRGHRVTTFTRGRRVADLPDGVTRLAGDRNGQVQGLKGKRWDAVIDDSATDPDWVAALVPAPRRNGPRYLGLVARR